MGSHMVRVDDETYTRLREIADKEHDTIGGVLSRALQTYKQREFWDQFDEAVQTLRSDPAAWQAELDERAAWDATVGDDLADDPYPLDGLLDDAPKK